MNRTIFTTLLLVMLIYSIQAQEKKMEIPFQGNKPLLTKFRMGLPESNKIEYIDLDNDGDPDVLKTVVYGGLPVLWIDDDDDMKIGDLEGDMDSDCLLVDRNKDGKYGHALDLIIDWNDENGDNKADMQVIADNSRIDYKGLWVGHYMCTIGNDNDGIFNFINWETLTIELWEHEARCKFFQDFHGNSIMLKQHTSTFNIDDLRYHWENPFIFLDPDNDGQTEMTIRLIDDPKVEQINYDSILMYPEVLNSRNVKARKIVRNACLSVDLDNDNDQDNELDYDFSICFRGNEGFNYEDQVNKFKSLKGLAGTDTFFYDPRWRQLDELIYTKPENALDLMFNKGKWRDCWFVYDEDDDCQRWERVELYGPGNMFSIGAGNRGLDDKPQADATGDRGEWDFDNSGRGQLYISPFDGRIHLYGAEWGAWRIDQNATYYQGWQGWRGSNLQPQDFVSKEPENFATIKYEDKDKNGFLDFIEYDLDGNEEFEFSVDLKELGINDKADTIDISGFKYKDFTKLHAEVANGIWENSQKALKVAEKLGLNIKWYTLIFNSNTIREKYHNGYWLNFYLYVDILNYAKIKQDKELINKANKAYFSMGWDILL